MPLDVTPHNAAELAKPITRPQWLVELGYTPVVRYASVKTVTVDAVQYIGRDMRVQIQHDGMAGSLHILDDQYTLTPICIANGSADIKCMIWRLYGDSASLADADLRFDGVMGRGAENDGWLQFQLRQPEIKYVPNIYMTRSNGFNHLPPPGTEFRTNDGIIVIE